MISRHIEKECSKCGAVNQSITFWSDKNLIIKCLCCCHFKVLATIHVSPTNGSEEKISTPVNPLRELF